MGTCAGNKDVFGNAEAGVMSRLERPFGWGLGHL